MVMKPKSMISVLNTAKEDDERLEVLGEYIIELADDDKKIDAGVIESLFKIHERLHDPSQALFNALESCAMGPQENIVRKLARESAMRKPNHCNLQLVGDGPESIKVLKKIIKRPKLDKEFRNIVKELIQGAEGA